MQTVTECSGEAARVTRYRYDGGPAPESWLPSSVQAPGAAASEAEALPGQGVPVRFSWSAMLRPESVTDSGGATASFDFDAEGSLLTLTPPETPAHDDTSAHGVPLSAHAGVVTSGYVHDDFGAPRSASHQWPGGELTNLFTYDAAGRIKSRTETADDTTTVYAYTYDAAGRLHEVHVDGALRESYDYDANGNRITAFAPASGRRPAYLRGPSLRRTQSAPQSGPVGALGLRPKSNAKLARSQALGRRSQGAAPGHQASGAQASGDVALDAQDRRLQYGALSFTYNAAGQLDGRTDTVSGEHTAYHYDELGRLLAVTLPTGIEVSYLIDAAGRRVGRRVGGSGVTDTLVYLDALRPAASPSRGQLYVYTSGRNVPSLIVTDSATYRVVTDWRGSVRRVIDTDFGVVVQAIDYTAYGRVLRDTNPGFQPFGFATAFGPASGPRPAFLLSPSLRRTLSAPQSGLAGALGPAPKSNPKLAALRTSRHGLTDPATHLVHFGARDYDPETARWLTKDPLLFGGGDTLLYAYVGGDPINFVDPSGELALLTVVGVAALIGGGVGVAVAYYNGARDIRSLGGAFVAGAVTGAGAVLGGEIVEAAAVAMTGAEAGVGAAAYGAGHGALVGSIFGQMTRSGIDGSPVDGMGLACAAAGGAVGAAVGATVGSMVPAGAARELVSDVAGSVTEAGGDELTSHSRHRQSAE